MVQVSVVATLVVGADGSTSKQGSSSGVSSAADRKAFLQRRSEVDWIIIGGNTARSEPYSRTPVPLIVISRSHVNPVLKNHLAQIWNLSPVQAVEKAQQIFGNKILIESGIQMITELIKHNAIDQLELSVTSATGGENQINWKDLLAKFSYCQTLEVEGTFFYSAHN